MFSSAAANALEPTTPDPTDPDPTDPDPTDPASRTPEPTDPASNKRKKPNASDQKRQDILCELLRNLTATNRVKDGFLDKVSEKYDVSRDTCQRILRRYFRQGNSNVASKMKGRCGGHNKRSLNDFSALKEVPKNKRTCMRAVSQALGVSTSTIYRRVRDGTLVKRNVRPKPMLSASQCLDRIQFVIDKVNSRTKKMNDMYDYVHVDEKWFYLQKTKNTYYMLPEEEVPYECCKSKRFIPKIMFLAAVARPRHCTRRNSRFDGLLGIWPFVVKEPAVRSSKNRPRGTLVTKPLHSVDGEAYEKAMTEHVLPAIKERWPGGHDATIILQEDNCRVHTKGVRKAVQAKAKEMDLNLVVKPQPANSPDFNVLDLGFFHAIQSLKDREDPKNVDELIKAVETAYWSQPYETVDNVFLSLQGAMIDSLKCEGSNKYRLRHMGKAKLRNQGQLPVSLECDPLLVAKGRELLDSAGRGPGGIEVV